MGCIFLRSRLFSRCGGVWVSSLLHTTNSNPEDVPHTRGLKKPLYSSLWPSAIFHGLFQSILDRRTGDIFPNLNTLLLSQNASILLRASKIVAESYLRRLFTHMNMHMNRILVEVALRGVCASEAVLRARGRRQFLEFVIFPSIASILS